MRNIEILLADDEAGIRRILRKRLEIDQYTIYEAKDGMEAWDFFQSHRTDILITDLNMPNMTGEALLKKVKRLCPTTRTIVLTGYGTLDSARQVIEAGCDEYLLKPVEDVSQISVAVKKCIMKQRALEKSVLHEKVNVAKTKYIVDSMQSLISPIYSLDKKINQFKNELAAEEENMFNGRIDSIHDDIQHIIHKLGKMLEDFDNISRIESLK